MVLRLDSTHFPAGPPTSVCVLKGVHLCLVGDSRAEVCTDITQDLQTLPLTPAPPLAIWYIDAGLLHPEACIAVGLRIDVLLLALSRSDT